MTLLENLAKIDKAPLVDFNPATDRMMEVNFDEIGAELSEDVIAETKSFTEWVEKKRISAGAKFGIGGYDEYREIYSRSEHFNGTEPRRLHLGVDIWGPAGTAVYAPLAGTVHSFKNNNNFGDYGPAIVLKHKIGNAVIHTLYGHLSLSSLENLEEGQKIEKGQKIAEFGLDRENGGWPPHLHFQLIRDMGSFKGDYPGVCKLSERGIYLANCPDPALLIQFQ
ncbi:peptidoglycan DD-metalloendopeptidase family protein [Solitalea lacus]|uniref:peptidoglycan DD-metalloendopeptidase family protein n=1 Tax=Solitalea lacus TaxID=2911172 RepID=UPI001EDA3350|nr:peptidoglycan DD-metalloendopeptidase family protein [Solitalea lacus]UKJ08194.1 peptidoglycan DD-metalloendopeptidase family protein [Solitalea lacus]